MVETVFGAALLDESIPDIPEGVCSVCFHLLVAHVDEKDWWRCHCLGGDGYQCECRLVKDEIADNREFYDYKKRMLEFLKELKKDVA